METGWFKIFSIQGDWITSPRIVILPFYEPTHVKHYPHHKDDLAQELNKYCAYKVEAHVAFHAQLGNGVGL